VGPFLIPPWKSTTPPRISGIRTYAAPLSKPEGTKVVRTFEELVPFIKAFAQDYFDYLVILGHSGLKKSTLLRSKLPSLAIR